MVEKDSRKVIEIVNFDRDDGIIDKVR